MADLPGSVRAVLFDFDFTLADSSAGAIECVRHAFRGLGLAEPGPEQILETVGLSLGDGFEALAGTRDASAHAAYRQLFVERADQVMAALTEVYAGVPEVLEALRAERLALGVVSTKFRYRIEHILGAAGLGDAFDVIVGGEDTERHKPHPEALHLACTRLGVPAAVYVGDHPVDAQAAAAAGMRFVAALTGTNGAEAFAGTPVLATVSALADLPHVLGVAGAAAR